MCWLKMYSELKEIELCYLGKYRYWKEIEFCWFGNVQRVEGNRIVLTRGCRVNGRK
jgi:hypothetical protein